MKQAFEDGDLSSLISLVTWSDPNQSPDRRRTYIQVQGDRVVELWEVGQGLITSSPNVNGPFLEKATAAASPHNALRTWRRRSKTPIHPLVLLTGVQFPCGGIICQRNWRDTCRARIFPIAVVQSPKWPFRVQ